MHFHFHCEEAWPATSDLPDHLKAENHALKLHKEMVAILACTLYITGSTFSRFSQAKMPVTWVGDIHCKLVKLASSPGSSHYKMLHAEIWEERGAVEDSSSNRSFQMLICYWANNLAAKCTWEKIGEPGYESSLPYICSRVRQGCGLQKRVRLPFLASIELWWCELVLHRGCLQPKWIVNARCARFVSSVRGDLWPAPPLHVRRQVRV